MRTLAIITARGGSKRIPGKNIKEFCGRPILSYSIAAARESGIFDHVMVSTDDGRIAEIAAEYGAETPFRRSPEASGDFATTADVVNEVLAAYREQGMDFEYACCIYPTAPFITGDKLKQGMELLRESGADSVVPVVRFSFPPQRCLEEVQGRIRPKWPEYAFCRSQDLEPLYHDCGQFYCFKTESFLKQQAMIMDHTLPLYQDEMTVQDIDTFKDWQIAEMKYRIWREMQEEGGPRK